MAKIQTVFWLSLLWITSATSLTAQPVSLGVFERVDIVQTEVGYSINNLFTCPLRYISHYPFSEGDELTIRIEPVPLCKSDFDAVKIRGSVRPRSSVKNDVVEVIYEGDNQEGPALIIYFDKPVKFSVSQGEDYRSVDVNVTTTN